MWHICLAAAIVVAMLCGPCWAGAWTLERGHSLAISGVTVSEASRSFDGTGQAGRKVTFHKVLAQNWIEYGLLDSVTLFAAPEFVSASCDTGSVTQARDFSFEGGARVLLLSRFGLLSLQASGKTAGAFDMSVSAGEASGSHFELRLLYGRNFSVLGRDGYADLEVAERWIRRPRPNEMTIDGSIGLRLRPGTELLLQNFNTVSGGGGAPPYGFYRLHKFELSVIQRLTPRWSLQVGGITSLAGQNVVKEQGVVAAIWYRL